MMDVKPLKDIASFIRTGKTPPTKEEKYFNGELNWYSPGDLDKTKYLFTAKRTITQLAIEDKKAITYPKNTLLIGCIGDIGKLGITSELSSSNQQLTGVLPNDETDVSYLYYWFRGNKKVLESYSNSAVVPILNNRNLETVKIPLPPLEQQKNIAAILDAADTYRQKTKALIKKYDELSQSLFLDMFGDPVKNPKGWDVTTIGKCFNVKGGKRLPKGSQYELKPTDHAYIRVKDFLPNGIDTSDIKYISVDIHQQISRYVISSEDVFLSIAGTIGVAGYIPEYLSGSNLTENAAKLIAKEEVEFRKEYLSFYLNSSYTQQHIKSKTMAVGVPKLALFRIQELPYINAPLDTQSEFLERLNVIETQKAQAQTSLAQAEDLFNSLLQKAFKGELV